MPANTAIIIGHKKLTKDVFELTCKTDGPFGFEAGQFITIRIDDGKSPCFRAYSISSKPEQSEEFQLCIKVVENGRGSNWLNTLEKGDKINFLGPNGKFVFKTSSEKKVLFIAVGVGIAPFKSIIEDQLINKKNNKQKLHLLLGLRYEEDIFYEDLFRELANDYKNFTFDLTLSRPQQSTESAATKKDVPGDGSSHKHEGRVTDLLKKTDIIPDQTEAYICGLKAMIDDVHSILKEKGLPEEAIHFEKYN